MELPIATTSPSTRQICASLTITEPGGILRNDIQYRLDIRRRAGDDAQNFAGRGLLFQRFGELTVTLLQLFVLCFLPQQRFGELLVTIFQLLA